MFGIAHLAQVIKEGVEKMSQATDRLTASVQAATASVDALITRIGTIPAPPPVDETPVLAAADAFDALKTKVDAVLPTV
jgi:hypothetical protein